MIEITDIGNWDETKDKYGQDPDVLNYLYEYMGENNFDLEDKELCGYNSDGAVHRWLKREWNNTDKSIKIIMERQYAYPKNNAQAFQLLTQKIKVESL